MVETKSLNQTVERWGAGMSRTPSILCPTCGRGTKSLDRCQWCKNNWNEEQLTEREVLRTKITD